MKCPECDGYGMHRHDRFTYAVPCQCCGGKGTATRADIQAHDRMLDAQSEAARRDMRGVQGILPASHYAQFIPAK
jgi:hypothetical protein